eukprot:5348016-Alexandrium_andersonii.AAC.1
MTGMVRAYTRASSAPRLWGPRGRELRAAHDPRHWGPPACRRQTPAHQELPPGRHRLHWAAHCPDSPQAETPRSPPRRTCQGCTTC